MSLIKERKVENIELFYDLTFAYAISKFQNLLIILIMELLSPGYL